MPPRIAPDRGAPRGQGRGGPSRGVTRGGGAGRGAITVGLPSIGANIRTIGVKRPDYGTAGRPIALHANSFVATIPGTVIRHYDAIDPSNLPVRLNTILIKKLQMEVAPDIFTPLAVYDGRKNMFAPRELPLGATHSREALNVVVRMHPNEHYPFNTRSFYTNRETKYIGGGIELWRGYFQSVRPGIGRMLINVDISTGMMYKAGPLIDLCLAFFNQTNPQLLSPAQNMPDRERLRLQRFISGLRITTTHTAAGGRPSPPRVIKKLSTAGADVTHFQLRDGTSRTVAQYFQSLSNRPLRFPGLLCVGSGALLPLEVCVVPPGQIMKKQLPPEKTKDVLDFATRKPIERFNSIREGLDPARIEQWAVVIYERQQRFPSQAVNDMIKGLVTACKSVGKLRQN
ncbi:hypothetical protein DXG03_002029 [Asterophora parasitica]|uniref:PAZ domain-containing protein n=1 Tax=Asterophora parasitica TaxID=117018 RepID=A0A9P7G999_9AGAR|nr:hypothetical protein DXG03_002029 [Asterophora parasitica]